MPLLQHDLIVLRGHIAYDIGMFPHPSVFYILLFVCDWVAELTHSAVNGCCSGNVGTFQDIPLSIQIFARRLFIDLTAHLHGISSDTIGCGSTASITSSDNGQEPSKKSVSKCVQAANDLLLWLTEVSRDTFHQ